MGLISERFSQENSRLADLRRSDATVDEICQDFEYLADLLQRSTDGDQLSDLRTSLAGLEAEIRKHLEKDTS